ncbi:hypothetical protein QTP88_012909 [Uroleucon formosanum]
MQFGQTPPRDGMQFGHPIFDNKESERVASSLFPSVGWGSGGLNELTKPFGGGGSVVHCNSGGRSVARAFEISSSLQQSAMEKWAWPAVSGIDAAASPVAEDFPPKRDALWWILFNDSNEVTWSFLEFNRRLLFGLAFKIRGQSNIELRREK